MPGARRNPLTGWKLAGWILLAIFLIASGLWVFAAFYLGWKWAVYHDDPYLARATTEDDVLAAGVIGYYMGKHDD